jgi:hypothetical protein
MIISRPGPKLRTALTLVGCASIAVGVGLAAVADAALLQGLTVAAFMTFVVFTYYSRRPEQGWARGNWAGYVCGAIVLRLLAGFVHLFVAFYLFSGLVDFVGFHGWVEDAATALLRGSLALEGIDMLGSGSVALLMVPFYYLLGSSISGMVLVSSLIGFVASYVFLRSFQVAGIHGGDVPFVAKVFFFLPSFIFWGSLFGKDSLIYLCLAGAAYCVAHLSHRFQLKYALGVSFFVVTTSLIRPHMGAPLGAALGIAWLLSRGHLTGAARALVPARVLLRVIMTAVMIAVPVYLVISLNKFVSFDMLYKDMARRHYVLSSATADEAGGLGSSLPPVLTGESPWEFVLYLPEGFATFVFRPLPFDAHNAQALIASMEGTLLVVIVVGRSRRLARSLRLAWSNTYLMFCSATFFLSTITLCFERNLGLIARHRIMVLPFLMLMLAVPLKKAPPIDDTTRPGDEDHDLVLGGREGRRPSAP